MFYRAPVAEQRFVLQHVAQIDALARDPRFAAATGEMIDVLLEEAAKFAEAIYAPLADTGDREGARWSDGAVHMPQGYREAYAAFVESGWGTISVPEVFGGQGMPNLLATIVMEDLGSANLGFSLINMLTPGAVDALIAHGSAEQHARWLPRLVTGEWNGTMCLTEPQAGSDVGAIRTMATPMDDGLWKIDGQKIFITFGEHDLTDNIVHLVLARTPDAPAGTRGISLFLVPKYRLDREGRPAEPNHVRCLSIERKLGIHVSPTCVMAFGEGGHCLGEMIGAEGGGLEAMFTMMNNARLSVGNQGVQVAERATQQALSYARDRRQSARADGSSGRTPVAIADHPDVRRMLMRMEAQTQAARALIAYTAGQGDRAQIGVQGARARADLLTPLCKAHGTDIGCEVASMGIQVHGGMGFIEETGAARHLRDARIAPIYEGTNGIQAADLVERKLVRDGGAALFALIADIRQEQPKPGNLWLLTDAVEAVARELLSFPVNDRLAGSYPFLTMVSVMTCGWLMARQMDAASDLLARNMGDPRFLTAKRSTASFYLQIIVPEALGLVAGATAGARLLYAAEAHHFSETR